MKDSYRDCSGTGLFRYRSAGRLRKITRYAGGKLSWSRYHDTGFCGNGFQNNNGPTRNDQLGAGAFGGYRVNPYLGFEMG